MAKSDDTKDPKKDETKGKTSDEAKGKAEEKKQPKAKAKAKKEPDPDRMITVKVIKKGVMGHLREPGEVMTIKASQFSENWMKLVGEADDAEESEGGKSGKSKTTDNEVL